MPTIMIPQIFAQHPYLTLFAAAFLVNIPLGYVRENAQKFSLAWLFWIHASIPLIIYLRLSFGISNIFIPVSIILAVFGQVLGSRLRRQKMTQADIERYDRLPDLRLRTQNHPPIKDSEVMVALLNMGGPKTNADVQDFQRRLFRDPLLIRFPLSSILQPFFAWLLIKVRGKETEKRYQLIGGGSPIFESTKNQTQALKEELHRRGRQLDATFSFNYSQPLPEETIAEIKRAGKKYILPLSLYPHYSSATTGSNLHYLRAAAGENYPELQFLPSPSYHLHDRYLGGFVDRILEQLKPGERLDDFFLIFSAHGLPLYFLEEGDPYAFEIAQTVGGVINKLKRDHDWVISYQSAVGPLQWLKPSTEATLAALARRQIKKVIVIPIAFVTDHIETSCEIDIEYREEAEKLGIADFRMTKALECHPGFISALADAVEVILPKRTAAHLGPETHPEMSSKISG